jgi:hypothetical protein
MQGLPPESRCRYGKINLGNTRMICGMMMLSAQDPPDCLYGELRAGKGKEIHASALRCAHREGDILAGRIDIHCRNAPSRCVVQDALS